jgi:rod shape-determining protein MreD
MNNLFTILLRFTGLVLVQALVLNQLVLFGMAVPLLYPLFVLLLPVQMAPARLLLWALAIGLTIDAFDQTGGMHGAATVFLAFVRPFILQLLTPRDGYQAEDRPTISSLGLPWLLVYTFLGFLVHHLAFFTLEVMSFSFPPYFLQRLGFSLLVSFFLALLTHFMFYSTKKQRALS